MTNESEMATWQETISGDGGPRFVRGREELTLRYLNALEQQARRVPTLEELVSEAYWTMKEQQKESPVGYNFWDSWCDKARPIFERVKAARAVLNDAEVNDD